MLFTKLRIYLVLILLISSVAISGDIIINLGQAKKAVKEYYSSGKYDEEVRQIINDALLNLNTLKLPENPAFIFDVDETALSNMEYEVKYDYGYIKDKWDEWVFEGKAPAIKEVKRFYDTLISKNISVIFITGRKYDQYDITLNNLKSEGYVRFDTLICKPKDFSGKTAAEYKPEMRKLLSKKYNIIGSIGDQWSDLEGGYTIMKIKIPNYLYHID